MAKKPYDWPEQGELIIGTIVRVNPFSVFITLDEYGNKEAMIHISEVARKWIRDIREFVKVGQKVVALVLKVDKSKGHVALSLKRVSRQSGDEKMKEFKREQKAEKMLEMIAKEQNMSLDEIYNQIGFRLQENFGEVFKAFQTVMKNEELFKKKGIEERWIKILKAAAEKYLEVKETTIKGTLEVRCYKPDGIEVIKKILSDAQSKYGVEIKYISAPKYILKIKSSDAKVGERTLKEAADTITKSVASFDGEAKFLKSD